jgi:hypothetical protein
MRASGVPDPASPEPPSDRSPIAAPIAEYAASKTLMKQSSFEL